MSMRQSTPKRKSHRRFWRVLMIAVLFAGLFVQITMISRISAENKRAAKAEDEIRALAYRVENLERDINIYRNSDEIKQRALDMGMQNADQTQLRSISVAGLEAEDTSAQAAGESGAEKDQQ